MPVYTNSKLITPKATGPYILAQSAVPVILAPNGTVATNGTITLGTALPTIYSGGAWVRLPAGAVSGGLAGLYWTVFSSTTVGAVKTNFVDVATAFTPYIPSGTLVAATGSNAAYTQTTASDITLANITVAGGMMGPNGALRFHSAWEANNNANAKTYKPFFGGVQMDSNSITTALHASPTMSVKNRGVLTSQLYSFNTTFNAFKSIDTSTDKALTFTGNLAVATDYIVLEGFIVEVLPA